MHLAVRKTIAKSSLIIVLAVAILSVGCGPKERNFTPSVETAKKSVEQALEQWKLDQPPGKIEGTKPEVFVTDNSRKAGQKLTGFKFLGESLSRSGRVFAIQLELKNPDEIIVTEYIVVGIDPLWVFRREDYDLLMHWDHHMPSENETQPKS